MVIHPLNAQLSAPMLSGSALDSSLSSSTSASDVSSANSLFLQLLTTQLQNQDPLDPLDPNQLTTQLVEINMLEQLAEINQTLQNAFPAASGSTPTTSTGSDISFQGAR